MKRAALFMLGALITALAIWAVLSPSAPTGPSDPNAVGAAAQRPAQPQRPQPAPAGKGAAAQIRSVQVGQTPPAQRANTPKAPTATRVSPQENAPSQAADDSKPPRKSSAELIAPFIQDDPTQVFLPDSVRNHAAVQAEPVDPEWGPGASQAMNDYLANQLGDNAELINADCRTDLCELQIVSRSGELDVQEIVSQMHHQPWWNAYEFDQDTGIVTFSKDGRIVMLWFYSRK